VLRPSAALACLAVLPRDGRAGFGMTAGPLALVFAAGVVLGETVNSLFVFTLHLLRVDGLLSRLAWPLPRAAVLAVFAAIASAAHAHSRVDCGVARPLAPGAVPVDRQLTGRAPKTPERNEMLAWVRANTAPEAVFLVPLRPPASSMLTERRVWVDREEGARALWAPWTHATWRRRYDEVRALATVAETLAYAERNGIDYVVRDRRRFRPEEIEPHAPSAAFANRWPSMTSTTKQG